jgi:hypothetical protein
MFPEKTKGRGLMHIEGTYTTEITTLEKHVERKENPLIQIVRPHQCTANSTMFQTANNLKKCVQSDTKQIKNITAQNLSEKTARTIPM